MGVILGQGKRAQRIEQVRCVVDGMRPSKRSAQLERAVNCSRYSACKESKRDSALDSNRSWATLPEPNCGTGALTKSGKTPTSGTMDRTANPGGASAFWSRTRRRLWPTAPTYATESIPSPPTRCWNPILNCSVEGGPSFGEGRTNCTLGAGLARARARAAIGFCAAPWLRIFREKGCENSRAGRKSHRSHRMKRCP